MNQILSCANYGLTLSIYSFRPQLVAYYTSQTWKRNDNVSENRTIFFWPIFLSSYKKLFFTEEQKFILYFVRRYNSKRPILNSVINFGYVGMLFCTEIHYVPTCVGDYTTAATLRYHFKLMT